MQNTQETPSKLIQALIDRSMRVIEDKSLLIGLSLDEIHEQHGMSIGNLIEAELIGHCHGKTPKKIAGRKMASYLKKGHKRKHSKKHKKFIRTNLETYLDVTRVACDLHKQSGGVVDPRELQTYSTILSIGAFIESLINYHILVSCIIDNVVITKEAGSRGEVAKKILEVFSADPEARYDILYRGALEWFDILHSSKSLSEIGVASFGDDTDDVEILHEIAVLPSAKYVQIRCIDTDTETIPVSFRSRVQILQLPSNEDLKDVNSEDVVEMLASKMGMASTFPATFHLRIDSDRTMSVKMDDPLWPQLLDAGMDHKLNGIYCIECAVTPKEK